MHEKWGIHIKCRSVALCGSQNHAGGRGDNDLHKRDIALVIRVQRVARLFCDGDAGLVNCGPPCLRRHDRHNSHPIGNVKRQKSRHDGADAGSYTPAIVDWMAVGPT